MPKVTLFVCVHGDRAPLSRLIERGKDCYDELLIVHDGPDEQDVESLVLAHGGRFLAQPRMFSQEPHLPIGIAQASHEWILKLDSDEYPSPELREWLVRFRGEPEPTEELSGYQCIWPVWDGRQPMTKRWPNNRVFLFRRDRVRCTGVYEQGITLDKPCRKLPLILCHEPTMQSHHVPSIFRKQRAIDGRRRLVEALLGSPLVHPRWRYEDDHWPPLWEEMVRRPLRTMFWRLIVWSIRQGGAMMLAREWPRPTVFMHSPVFHALVCFDLWKAQRRPAHKEVPCAHQTDAFAKAPPTGPASADASPAPVGREHPASR